MNRLSVLLYTRRVAAGRIDKWPIEQDISGMIVHLIDGTYELFRHFYGVPADASCPTGRWAPWPGVLGTIVQMLEGGATHIGVATDHVIESFRNDLWPGYKTGEGIEPALWAQFHPLEESLVAMGVDDVADGRARGRRRARVGRASRGARHRGSRRCASGRRTRISRSASSAIASSRSIAGAARFATTHGVRAKFGVAPAFIPDYLALVGDAADGYPGIPGIGAKTAARLIGAARPHRAVSRRAFSGSNRERALLFKKLATLRTDAPLFDDVEQLRWKGPTEAIPAAVEKIGNPRLAERVSTSVGLYSFAMRLEAASSLSPGACCRDWHAQRPADTNTPAPRCMPCSIANGNGSSRRIRCGRPTSVTAAGTIAGPTSASPRSPRATRIASRC